MKFEVEWDKGIKFKGIPIWFNAKHSKVLTHLSSAGLERVSRYSHAFCTHKTRDIIRVISPSFVALTAPYRRQFQVGKVDVELYPAGVLPGSSMALISTHEERVLVALEFDLEYVPLSEQIEIPKADTLVLYCAKGRKHRKDTIFDGIEYCEKSLQKGEPAVFQVDNPVYAILFIYEINQHNFRIKVHQSIYRFLKVFRNTDLNLDNISRLCGEIKQSDIVILPSKALGKRDIKTWRMSLLSRQGEEDCIKMIKESGAKYVYAYGEGAKTLEEAMLHTDIRIHVIRTEEQLKML